MCLLIHRRTSSLHFFTWTLIGDTRPVPQYLTTQFAPPVLLPGNFISPSILSILQDRARRLPFYIACPNSTKKNDLILHNTLQNTARPTVLFYSIMTHISSHLGYRYMYIYTYTYSSFFVSQPHCFTVLRSSIRDARTIQYRF